MIILIKNIASEFHSNFKDLASWIVTRDDTAWKACVAQHGVDRF